jgi:hypothetical protein
VVVVLAFPVYLVSDPEGRRIVSILQLAGATTPERAMTAYELGADDSRTLPRLVRRHTITETGGGRYFVNASAVPREHMSGSCRRNRRRSTMRSRS